MADAYTDTDYVIAKLFPGETEVSLRSIEIATAQEEHDCCLSRGAHKIPPGALHRHDRAMLDGVYVGTCRACLPCLDKHIIAAALANAEREDD